LALYIKEEKAEALGVDYYRRSELARQMGHDVVWIVREHLYDQRILPKVGFGETIAEFKALDWAGRPRAA
jgi:hypothetical protein